jgi:hypothetical protein
VIDDVEIARALHVVFVAHALLDIVAWLTLKRRAKSAWLALPSASAFRASRF